MTTQLKPFKPSSIPWEPAAFQLRAVKFLLEHAAAALLLDPGLRKTSITLAAIKVLLKRKVAEKVLVIAPLRVCYNVWPAEVEKWKDFNHLRVQVLHGPKKEEALNIDADIYVINPEGLEWLFNVTKEKRVSRTGRATTVVTVDHKRLKALGFDTLVVDELTKFKNTNSQRYKIMKAVIHTFARRWGLTGSVAANGLEQLFGQVYILDQGRALGQYITHYRKKYFNPHPSGFGWVIKEGSDKEIYKKLKPLALRMDADDYIKLPKLIENNVVVELPEPAMKIYQEMEDDLLATLVDGRKVSAAAAGAAYGKCRQIASGAIYLNPDVEALLKLPSKNREWALIHDEKLDALVDLVEELQGKPLLIAYHFGHDKERIIKALGKDVPVLDSNQKKSQQLIDAWNRGDLPYLLGQPQSMGHGLNMQEVGNHLAIFTPDPDYELYDQLIRRLRRSGSKAAQVFVHRFVAKGTLDMDIVNTVLPSKKGTQQALFDALVRRRKKS